MCIHAKFTEKKVTKNAAVVRQYIVYSNCCMSSTDFTDYSEYWQFPYESASLRFDLEDVWEEIRPLYEQLHAYVRRKLRDLHGPEKISREAPLPAHILGKG